MNGQRPDLCFEPDSDSDRQMAPQGGYPVEEYKNELYPAEVTPKPNSYRSPRNAPVIMAPDSDYDIW